MTHTTSSPEHSLRGLGGIVALTVLASLVTLVGTGCSFDQAGVNPCLNKTTAVAPTGARHVLDVALPFEPGPLVVVTPTADGPQLSRSSRLWLGDEGLSLYALQGPAVWRIDLGTFEKSRVGAVDRQAEQLAGSEEDDALLVTDSARGAVWVLDQTRLAPPVRIPVGATPTAVALGPGRRLAYVANAGDWSLSLVETGVGVASPAERTVLVGAAAEGALLRLDGDGRPRARYDGLPAGLTDLTVIAGGRLAVASYTELVTTGNPGTLGDGTLVLDEGLVTVDLDSGAVARYPLPRAQGTDRAGALADPSGLLDLGDGTVAVALPGWSAVAVMDVDPASDTRGAVVREIALTGQPRWIARATFGGDWLYVLDDDGAAVSVVDAKGHVTRQVAIE